MSDSTSRPPRPLLVGMVHLRPLPGSPRYRGSMRAVTDAAVADAAAIVRGGFDAVLIENFGDTPFLPGAVGPETVAAMTAVAARVRTEVDCQLGINVLRNDGRAALAVAGAVGASFIRVNVLSGARVTDQGVIEGRAGELMRERARLGLVHVGVWADVGVKHSAALAPRPLADEVRDLTSRALADAVIVSGVATGQPVDVDRLRRVSAAAESVPVFVGSGVDVENAATLARYASAMIVGTSIKRGGVDTPVDEAKVRAISAVFAG